MVRWISTAALLCLSWPLWPVPGAAQQVLSAPNTDYQPLVYSKEGKLYGCGIRVFGVDENTQAFDVGLSQFSDPARPHFFVVLKVLSYSLKADKSGLDSVAVKSGWVKAGALNTASVLQRGVSEDPNAFSAVVHNDDTFMAQLPVQMLTQGFLLGYRLSDTGFDTVVQVPASASDETKNKWSQCMADLLKD